MTVKEIMTELESYGEENIKKILLKHGVKEPFFGVKVEKLKVIQKRIKKDYALANELYFTNNADAMYLAGLIADDDKMTKEDLQAWVKLAVSNNINGYTVPWVAAESHHGFELALEWIDSNEEHIASAGWATLGGLVAIKSDEDLNMPALKNLLTRVEKTIQTEKNRVKYFMNAFVIAVGSYVKELTNEASAVATKIGVITVDMNGTSCKVPDANMYIKKVIDKNGIGKKKKTVKC
ncbi:DNA alkylation repair protein [Flavobacterium sp.]|uniref:DNA alkylation repair protein n=1 Tax=Flavobacterium sp. TaxID=239 RepID=UPI00260D2795|nr:DNA alkylation repair protein [Flavobacterium sp.]